LSGAPVAISGDLSCNTSGYISALPGASIPKNRSGK
jgi:hypothetical protein